MTIAQGEYISFDVMVLNLEIFRHTRLSDECCVDFSLKVGDLYFPVMVTNKVLPMNLVLYIMSNIRLNRITHLLKEAQLSWLQLMIEKCGQWLPVLPAVKLHIGQ